MKTTRNTILTAVVLLSIPLLASGAVGRVRRNNQTPRESLDSPMRVGQIREGNRASRQGNRSVPQQRMVGRSHPASATAGNVRRNGQTIRGPSGSPRRFGQVRKGNRPLRRGNRSVPQQQTVGRPRPRAAVRQRARHAGPLHQSQQLKRVKLAPPAVRRVSRPVAPSKAIPPHHVRQNYPHTRRKTFLLYSPTLQYNLSYGRDAFEYDDKRDQARQIVLGQTQSRTIYPDEDKDWIIFYPPTPGRYVVDIVNPTIELKGEIRYRLIGEKEKKAKRFEFPEGGGRIILGAPHGLEYFKLKFEAQDDDETGLYRVHINVQNHEPVYGFESPWSSTDPPYAAWQNGHYSFSIEPTPKPHIPTLLIGQTLRNIRGRAGSKQLFRLFVPHGAQALKVMTGGGKGNLALLVQPAEAQVAQQSYRSEGGTLHTLTFPRVPAGWYLIVVEGLSSYEGVELAARLQ